MNTEIVIQQGRIDALPEVDAPAPGEVYLEHIRQAKEEVDIPVIASLNGICLPSHDMGGKYHCDREEEIDD